MKSLKKEIVENSEVTIRDCGCCSDFTINTQTLFAILKSRNIEVEK